MPAARRKLLFYTHAMTGGGAERVWALLASGFARRGFEVILAVDFAAVENMSHVDPAVQIVVLAGNHFISTWRLSALMRREAPDISLSAISVSNIKHFLAALMAGRLRRSVQSYHGYAESEPQFLSRIGYLMTPLTTRLFARTIAVSDGLRTYIIDKWSAAANRTQRIYNPLPARPGAIPQSEADLLRRDPIVVASGRLVDYKDFGLLIAAFALVRQPGARLILMGEGPERQSITRAIAQHGLSARVELTGYHADPWAVYDQARCFVLTSRSESFGLVIGEALSRGLAVVSTDCDGPREILDGGRFGAIVTSRDASCIAQAIDAALAAPGDPAPRMGRAGDYNLDAALDVYQAMFENVLQGRVATCATRIKPA